MTANVSIVDSAGGGVEGIPDRNEFTVFWAVGVAMVIACVSIIGSADGDEDGVAKGVAMMIACVSIAADGDVEGTPDGVADGDVEGDALEVGIALTVGDAVLVQSGLSAGRNTISFLWTAFLFILDSCALLFITAGRLFTRCKVFIPGS